MTSGINPIESSPTNAEIATWLNNTLLPVLDGLLRSDNTLQDNEVRARHLHEDARGLFAALQAAAAAGLRPLVECVCATIGNHGLTGLAAIDGVTPTGGQRVLVRAQTDPTQNGIYAASAGAWTRATDADAMDELGGAFVWINGGTTLGQSAWANNASTTGTIGTVDVVWIKLYQSRDGTQGIQGIPGTPGTPGTDGADGDFTAPIAAHTLVGNKTGGVAPGAALTQTEVVALLADWQAELLWRFKAKVIDVAADFTLDPAVHMGAYIRTMGGPIVVTCPANMPKGFTCTLSDYWGDGLSFVAGAGAAVYNRQNHTQAAGVDAVVGIACIDNNGGLTAAEFELFGDTKA